MGPEHNGETSGRGNRYDNCAPEGDLMPFHLNDAEEEKAHGELGHGISGDGESIRDISPKYRIRGIRNAEFPEVLSQPVLDRNLDEDREAQEKDLCFSSA